MSSAWLLPEHIADVLPAEARRLEELRRRLLQTAAGYGFEQVMPPLIEHLESLLSGQGSPQDLRTFKLVDQLSGRMVGVRADATPQVARIDAHLLNREGVVRLCYCGPVLHARPASTQATREPLQLGAELYGHAGIEADLEIQELALDCLRTAGLDRLVIDLSDARVLRGVLAGASCDATRLQALAEALAAKDAPRVQALAAGLPDDVRRALQALPSLYGGDEVLERAAQLLPRHPQIQAALADLATLAAHLRRSQGAGLQVGFDLADVGGYGYYTGARFAVYRHGVADAVLRGGRYDEVGAVFGRNRPAVGFSTDLKTLAACLPAAPRRAAVRAPWGEQAALRSAIRALRDQGHVVVCSLPGHGHETEEFACDRELVAQGEAWVLRPCELA
ncbi:MAG: hypothetical protein RIQ53_2299 [Pseudomonadota bacterium]